MSAAGLKRKVATDEHEPQPGSQGFNMAAEKQFDPG